VVYQFTSLDATTQANVKNTIMPTVLKIVDKHLQVRRHPGTCLALRGQAAELRRTRTATWPASAWLPPSC
jgi:hypothetical protein